MKSCPPEAKLNIKMADLQDLFISKTRVKLLEIFFSQPRKIFYVRQLVRLTDEQINAVRRELARMEAKKIASKEERGNRIYYRLREDYPFYAELLVLVAKTTGLGGQIIQNKEKIGRVKFAMLSGRFSRGLSRQKDSVALLLVGEIVLPQVTAFVRAEEVRRKEEVNYTIMTEEEFNFRKRRRDPFITKVLTGSRVMLIGDEEKMLEGLE